MTMSNTNYISEIAAALHIDPQGPVSWLGEKQSFPVLEKWTELSPEDQRHYHYKKLQDTLYAGFYMHGEPQPINLRAQVPGNGGLDDLLAASHDSKGHWDKGWATIEEREEEYIVSKDGIRLRVERQEVRQTANGAEVLMPGGRSDLSPGFYAVIGDAGYRSSRDDEDATTTRIYFAISANGAAALTACLTRYFNDRNIPFFYKVLNDVASYGRADAAVLYVDKSYYPVCEEFVRACWEEVSPFLIPKTTAFSLPIAEGISVAEDPGNGQSFGEHRCGLMAEALLRQHATTGESELIECAHRVFEKAGIDMTQSHLPKSSDNVYKSLGLSSLKRSQRKSAKANAPSSVEIAASIGHIICDQAIWHKDRCNWMSKFHGEGSRLLAKAMDAGVYDGSSGVAWFLAELYKQSGEERFREVALASCQNALDRTDELKEKGTFSFHQGLTGVLAAALITAELCEDKALRDRATKHCDLLDESVLNDKESDLLGGLAGSLCGAIMLARLLPGNMHLPVLIRAMGDELMRNAEVQGDKASWRGAHAEQHHNLCGMSHGASGVALALAEAGQFLDTDKYKQRIRQALRYEDQWYDAAHGKWPDLRYHAEGKSLDHVMETVFWCHGAPGISLARHQIGTVLNDDAIKAAAARDLQVTLLDVTNALQPSNAALSMCHGVCGNASVLIPHGLLTEQQQRVIETQVYQHVSELKSQGQSIPSLGYFTGLSGMGHYLLCAGSGRLSPMLLPVGALLPIEAEPVDQCLTTMERAVD